MEATISRLARHVSGMSFEQLPPAAVHECRRRIVDSVACAAGAFEEPFCARLRDFARAYAGVPAARVWGTGAPTSLEMAAFANGTMVRYLDYSDTWLARGAGHPSDMIPGLVAVAEGHGASGRDLVVAIVAAYDAYCSLCESAFGRRVLDQATAAAVGAAAGAARLLGLDEHRTAQALSLALVPNLHLYAVRQGQLSDWKGCAGPNGARNGVFAALAARAGITGPGAPVDGPGGLAELIGAFEWTVAAGLPMITGTHIKLHPVCYHGQAAIDAALALRSRLGLDGRAAVDVVDAIEDIHVETYESAWRMTGGDPSRWAPATRETADHSIPYTVAMVLREGRLESAAYADAPLHDPTTRALMQRLRVSAIDEFTKAYPAEARARLTIRLRDGTTASHLQRLPRGHAANPVTDAELEAKFVTLHAAWGDAAAAARCLEVLWAVDRLGDVRALVDALCAPR